MVELILTRNTTIAILGIIITICVIWMMCDVKNNSMTTEGFASTDLSNYGYTVDDIKSNAKRELFGNVTGDDKKPSKLARLKRSHKKKSANNASRYTKNRKDKRSSEAYTNVLKWLDEDNEDKDPGKYDNFQDVLDEIDRIDVTAFGINSMGNTIKRYSKNIDDRMKYAYKKNKNSRLDSSMAQLGILTSEFRKLFAVDKLL